MNFWNFVSGILWPWSKGKAPPEYGIDRVIASPGWGFKVRVHGDDLCVDGTWATCFGGGNDPQDDGDTASGTSTKGNPRLAACALPMRYLGPHIPTRHALAGTPLPRLPWNTPVQVSDGSTTITVPVIDLGPARHTGNGIDLTIAAARRFDPTATATNFKRKVSYRVKGGARFL